MEYGIRGMEFLGTRFLLHVTVSDVSRRWQFEKETLDINYNGSKWRSLHRV